MKRQNNEQPIADVLKSFIQSNNLEAGLERVDVEKLWRSLLGKGVNSYTREVRLKGATLYVTLSSSVLREELSYGKQKIIGMLNDELGKEVVKELVLR
jgi:hypothetical protein